MQNRPQVPVSGVGQANTRAGLFFAHLADEAVHAVTAGCWLGQEVEHAGLGRGLLVEALREEGAESLDPFGLLLQPLLEAQAALDRKKLKVVALARGVEVVGQGRRRVADSDTAEVFTDPLADGIGCLPDVTSTTRAAHDHIHYASGVTGQMMEDREHTVRTGHRIHRESV